MHKIISMAFIKYYLMIAFIAISTFVSAQNKDSKVQTVQSASRKQAKPIAIDKDSLQVLFTHDKTDSLKATTYYKIDTLVERFQYYNPTLQPNNPMASQGNIGEASYPLIYNPITALGFDFGRHSFDPFIFTPANLIYYISKRPYTVLNYVSGKGKEQLFRVTHSQSLRKGLYLTVDYNLTNSVGIYDKEGTNEYALGVSLNFTRPDLRYQGKINFTNNYLKVQENGGLADLSIFEENKEPNRALIQTNLTDARNYIHQTGAYIHHTFYLGKLKAARPGTSFWDMIVNTFNAGTLGHIFQYDIRTDKYIDTTRVSKLYPTVKKDQPLPSDSIRFSRINNTFYWTNQRDSILQVLTLKFGVNYELVNVGVLSKGYTFNQTTPFGQFSLNAGKNIEAFGKLSLTTGGYNDKDYHYAGGIRTHFGQRPHRQIIFEGEIYRNQTEPGYFYHYYNSNRYTWNNSLTKTKTSGIRAKADIFGLHLSANFFNLSDFVYLDTASIAKQSNQTANILQLSADYSLHLGGLTFRNVFNWQNIAGTNYIRLPQMILNSTLSYRKDLFNKALSAETGVEMLYTSSFKGNAYNPALGMYRLQDNTTIGDYPYMDVFANLKVKRTRIFVKYQHVNAGMMKYRYYFVPGYPQNDAAFKFGFSWIFFD
jgi:hypothetical protein